MPLRSRSAEFVTSASSPSGFPKPTLPEIAFAGRSNVGKSSLINAITGKKGLARTSATPGRTRLLNWFRVASPLGGELHFVDLPGYGYAKVPREMRASWRPLVDSFMTARDTLVLTVLIVDARRGPEDEERELLDWLGELGRRVLVVLTKADKLPKAKRLPAAAAAKRALGLKRDPVLFSAETAEGIDELWRVIDAATKAA
jgi:GTP-binding protein